MKARIFNIGDKVKHINGGPIMTVEKYATNYRPLMGWEDNDFLVICVWKSEGRFHREIIDQSELCYINEEPIFPFYGRKKSNQESFRSYRN